MAIHLKVHEQEDITFLFVDETAGTQPIDLQKMEFPGIDGSKGLIFSAPVSPWIRDNALLAYRNRSKWIASYDPRIGGAVVVVSLSPDRVVGELIPLKLPCLKCFEEGDRNWVRSGAKYPYCTKHQWSAPHLWKKEK